MCVRACVRACVRVCVCVCVRTRVLSLSLAIFFLCMYIFFNAHYRLVSRINGVHFNMVCMNVHVLNIL